MCMTMIQFLVYMWHIFAIHVCSANLALMNICYAVFMYRAADMMILTFGHTNTFGSEPRVVESPTHSLSSTQHRHTQVFLSASAPPVLPTHLSSWLDWLVLFWDQKLKSATMKENSFLLHLLAAQDIPRAFHLADCLSEADSIHLYLYRIGLCKSIMRVEAIEAG